MSLPRLHSLVFLLLVAFAAACATPQRPQLKVLGIEQSENAYEGRRIKLFVEVVNYARRPMKLQRLQYVFGPAGAPHGDVARGEVALARTIEAGSAIVVEVPILLADDVDANGQFELRGQLIAEQDEIVRAYPVTAAVAGEAASTGAVLDDPAE